MTESEIIVSLSMKDFNILKEYKEKYINLSKGLKDCINKGESELTIDFDAVKALELCKSLLPKRYQDGNFVICTD